MEVLLLRVLYDTKRSGHRAHFYNRNGMSRHSRSTSLGSSLRAFWAEIGAVRSRGQPAPARSRIRHLDSEGCSSERRKWVNQGT